jgi:hypothetical protein
MFGSQIAPRLWPSHGSIPERLLPAPATQEPEIPDARLWGTLVVGLDRMGRSEIHYAPLQNDHARIRELVSYR